MKVCYAKACCMKCKRYDADDIFKIGFDDPVTLRFKGEYGFSNDRVFAINERFRSALVNAGVRGYETKPLGSSGWHALRVTRLVDHSEKVIKSRRPLCPECGRPKESYGAFEHRRELSLPRETNTFFSTKGSWPSWFSADRQVFITENVLEALKGAGIKGGYCNRLLTDEEYPLRREKEKKTGGYWMPPKTTIFFNGKPQKGKLH